MMREEQEAVIGYIAAERSYHDCLAWCVLYTRHQHEKQVAQMLSAKGLQVFLPLYESLHRWRDRNKLLQLPLFPCYVFVRGAVTHRLEVLTTPGVHMIVCKGNHIATIPEDEIEAIRRSVNGPFRVEPHPFLNVGERVRVTRGALQGLEGLLIRSKGACRLVLSVQMLAQSVAVEIDRTDVESTSAFVPARDFAAVPAAGAVDGMGSHREGGACPTKAARNRHSYDRPAARVSVHIRKEMIGHFTD
jgi:transcription antitermination factor NusG